MFFGIILLKEVNVNTMVVMVHILGDATDAAIFRYCLDIILLLIRPN